jgi:hypothetical protein
MILDGDNVTFVSAPKKKQEEEEQAAAFQVCVLVHKKKMHNPFATTNCQKQTGLQHTTQGWGPEGSTE